MFRLGGKVEILKEFQNSGDEKFTWIVVGDEEKGRVDITHIDINLDIKPINTVQAHWIKLAND